MTTELWSVASVASYTLKQQTTDETHDEVTADEEVFLRSFAALIERLCKAQYDRETKVVRS